MSTLRALADQYGFQPVELAAFLTLEDQTVPDDYEFTPEDETEFRHILNNTEDGIYVDPATERTD
jgi:hypothetical protein